jgi:hypothetical protein
MGSKKSSTQTNTTTAYYDQRQVNDAGGGIAGSGNYWDSSTTWAQLTDASNNSTNHWTDNSTTTYQVLDAGQTEAARQIALAAITAARDSSTTATSAAVRAQESAIASGERTTRGALDLAQTSTAAAFRSNTEAMGWAGERFDQLTGLTSDLLKASAKNADSAAANVAGAYSAAASQANGNKTLTIAALAAVGLVAVVVAMKKG